MGVKLNPRVMVTNTYRVPVVLAGRFTLAGASSPTAVAGVVESVTRHVTAAADIFFRVQLNEAWNLSADSAVVYASGSAVDVSDDLTVHHQVSALTASPAATFDASRQFDVVVRDGGADVDTAGIVVNLILFLDQWTS